MSVNSFVDRAQRSAGTRPTSLILAVVCIAQFMVVLDVSIVNVALPDMRNDLHMSQNGLAWVLNAYTLTFAGFLLLGGRAADLWGRKRLFLIGVTVFSVTSLLGGLAQNGGELITARALQGLGGAILSPATLTILTTTFTDPKARTRALGLWSAVAGAGGATGVLAGGILTDLFSWRWILFINVPIGIAVLVLARIAIPESRLEGAHPRLDWLGALTVTGGLVAIVYGVVSTDQHAWSSPLIVGSLVIGVALLGLFVFVQSRHSHPLVPLRLFKSRALTGANLIMIVLGSALFGMFFFLSEYLQDVRGYSPLKTGLGFLPLPIAIIIGTQISARIVGRVGPRILLIVGPLISAVGMLMMSRLGVDSSYAVHIGLAGFVTTFGVGLSFVPITLSATNGVAPADAGLASGLINTTRQIGGSLGLAVLLTVASSRSHALVHDTAHAAETAGFTRAFEVAAVLLVLAAVIAFALIPRPVARSGSEAESAEQVGDDRQAEPVASEAVVELG
jgi:EmrB/QacA subfamily drug resistance transporter